MLSKVVVKGCVLLFTYAYISFGAENTSPTEASTTTDEYEYKYEEKMNDSVVDTVRRQSVVSIRTMHNGKGTFTYTF